MDSIDPECTKLKQKYEACFYSWYSEKYLTGKSREDECAPLFKEYRQCLEVKEESFGLINKLVLEISSRQKD